MSKTNTARKSEETVEVKVEKVNTVLRDNDIDKVMEELKTKSAAIRLFTSQGHSRSDIAKAMNIRYQHVRNVQVQDALKATVKAEQEAKSKTK